MESKYFLSIMERLTTEEIPRECKEFGIGTCGEPKCLVKLAAIRALKQYGSLSVALEECQKQYEICKSKFTRGIVEK